MAPPTIPGANSTDLCAIDSRQRKTFAHNLKPQGDQKRLDRVAVVTRPILPTPDSGANIRPLIRTIRRLDLVFPVDLRRTMKKLDVAQILSILANLGVIAGIVFLGFELRQDNTLMASQSRAGVRFIAVNLPLFQCRKDQGWG
jgi:hypothetical protein